MHHDILQFPLKYSWAIQSSIWTSLTIYEKTHQLWTTHPKVWPLFACANTKTSKCPKPRRGVLVGCGTRNLWRFRHGSCGIRVSFSGLLEGIPRRPSPGCVPRKEATDHRIPRSTHWGYGLKSYVQRPKQYDNVLQRPFPLLVKWVAVERSKQHPI